MVSNRGTVSGLLQRTYHGRLYKPGSKKGVIISPGATQDVDWWSGAELLLGLRELDRVTQAGWPMATLTTALTWGNAAILTDVSTLRTNNQTSGLFAAGKVHLVGVSMGGLIVLNWAKANPTLVQSITLLIPCVNVQGIWDEDRNAFKAGITAAHGGRPPDSANPLTNAETFGQFRVNLFYSTTDTITTLNEQRLFGARCGATMWNMGALGHFWGAPWSGAELARIIQANDA